MNNGCEFGVCVCVFWGGGGMGQTIQQLNQIADI